VDLSVGRLLLLLGLFNNLLIVVLIILTLLILKGVGRTFPGELAALAALGRLGTMLGLEASEGVLELVSFLRLQGISSVGRLQRRHFLGYYRTIKRDM